MKFKILLLFALACFSASGGVLAQEQPRWESLCNGSSNPYCVAVGRGAYNSDTVSHPMWPISLGKIIGVVWVKQGQTVSAVGEELKLAPKNDYYYIIDNQINDPFLRLCSEIKVKPEELDEGLNQD